MEHINILSYIAKDIQKTCERLGIYAEFTPRSEKLIESSDFKIQPAIFKKIFVQANINTKPSTTQGEDDVLDINVSLNYRYNEWDGGENGGRIGWMKYQVQKSHFEKDEVYMDGLDCFCNIKKWRGIEL